MDWINKNKINWLQKGGKTPQQKLQEYYKNQAKKGSKAVVTNREKFVKNVILPITQNAPISGEISDVIDITKNLKSKKYGSALAGIGLFAMPNLIASMLKKPTQKAIANLPLLEQVDDLPNYFDEYKKTNKHPIFTERFEVNQLDQLKNKYKKEFIEKFGKLYDDKDLGLYAKWKELNNIDPIDLNKAKQDILNRSQEFVQKHGIQPYSKEHELLIDAYTKGYDSRINNRTPGKYEIFNQDFYAKFIAPQLEEVIKSNKLKNSEVLYRYDSSGGWFPKEVIREGKPVSGIAYEDLKVGDIWTPGSFISTSLDKDLSFANPLFNSVIKVPAGSSVGFPNVNPKASNFPNEMEAILPSKLKFEVKFKRPEGKSVDEVPYLFGHTPINPYTIGGLGLIGASQLKSKQNDKENKTN